MLDRVHKISEIVASAAIIASLIFVGVQVNQNTRTIDAQVDNSVWLPWVTVQQMIGSSPDLADIYVRAQADGLAALSAAEILRFDQYMMAVFTVTEPNYRAMKRNPDLVAREVVREVVITTIAPFNEVANVGGREWWARVGAGHYFHLPFVAFVNQAISGNQN